MGKRGFKEAAEAVKDPQLKPSLAIFTATFAFRR